MLWVNLIQRAEAHHEATGGEQHGVSLVRLAALYRCELHFEGRTLIPGFHFIGARVG
jgi:hypothetical protein